MIKKLFESAKLRIKDNITWKITQDAEKNSLMLRQYCDITPKYIDYINAIDSITPEELQQAAIKYFSTPYIEAIEE